MNVCLRNQSIPTVFLVGVSLTCIPVSAAHHPRQTRAGLPRRPSETLEERVLLDARDSSLDEFSLLEAACVANGPSEAAALDESLHVFEQHVNQCRRRLEPDATTLEVVELISNYLHQQLLTGTYQITASSPAETLRSGDYNCLSATILFQAVCQRLALPAQAMGTTGHVYSRVGTELPIDVETTLPEWRQSTMRQQSVTARELTDVQLLAKVYYNRGVRLLEERDYREALQSAWHSCQLDPADTVARRNLLASINNWALELCEENEYQAASSLLSHGRQLDASYRPFDTNDMYLHGRWMTHLRRIGEYDQALDIVKRAIERWPDVPYFLQQQAAIARQMGDRVATGK